MCLGGSNNRISLEEACIDLGINPDLTLTQEEELYGAIFQCSICGFWCEVCENGWDGLICKDCLDEEEEEE